MDALPSARVEKLADVVSAGTIIFLNGPSSAGKTTIATSLQETLTEPFLCVGADWYLYTLPRRYFGVDPAPGTLAADGFQWLTRSDGQATWYEIAAGPLGHRAMDAAQRATATLARAGMNLIVDEVLLYPDWLLSYLRVLGGIDVLFVGVHCPLAVLEEGERLRGDRRMGQARGHHERVHAHRLYDVEVDTSASSAEECARAIKERLEAGPPFGAFAQLRARGATSVL